MSVFCQAVVYLLVALPAVAQSQAFATITIKPARSADPRNARVQVLPNGDLIASAVPVITLLSYAYDVPVNPSPRLSPLPDWTLREKYDIEAKAPANAIPPSLQDSEVRSRIQQMIRGLLADRFRLVMRVENKTMSVYALTVASGGPKLQKSAIAEKDCTFDTDPEGCHNFVGGLGHPLNAKAIEESSISGGARIARRAGRRNFCPRAPGGARGRIPALRRRRAARKPAPFTRRGTPIVGRTAWNNMEPGHTLRNTSVRAGGFFPRAWWKCRREIWFRCAAASSSVSARVTVW